MAYVPSDVWSDEVKKEIASRLNARRVVPKCPMCGTTNFAIGDGYLAYPLQLTLTDLRLNGPTLPAVAIICTNCGFISQHALGVLGFLDAPASREPK
jgi:hypothetical protein